MGLFFIKLSLMIRKDFGNGTSDVLQLRLLTWIQINMYVVTKGAEWESELRWILLFFWIRLGFHLWPFSYCHWYFLINELQNQVSFVIMLLLLSSSLRCMLLHGVDIMAKCTFFSLKILQCTNVYISYNCISWCEHLSGRKTLSIPLSILLC